MSRQIDMSDPAGWTEDDVQYLSDRNQLPEGFKFTPSEETGETETEVAQGETGSVEVDVDEDEDMEVLYESMSTEDLKNELRTRGLPVSGTKHELVERLVENDEVD